MEDCIEDLQNMDEKLIQKFREKINEHNLIYHIYKNREGKNKWGGICSAIDWIETCIEGIDVDKLEMDSSNAASIKFMTFISCIDIMWEGVSQLHRIFFETDKLPFTGNNSIFGKEMDDNSYWKEIRAAFAAHPTNLTGEPKGEHNFASWSGHFGYGDFSVLVYSNDPGQDASFFDVNFDEIYSFALKRYEYINILSERVDETSYEKSSIN